MCASIHLSFLCIWQQQISPGWSQTPVVSLFDCAPLRRLFMWFSVWQGQVNIWIATWFARRAPPSQCVRSTSGGSSPLNLHGVVLHPMLSSFHPLILDSGSWSVNWCSAKWTFGAAKTAVCPEGTCHLHCHAVATQFPKGFYIIVQVHYDVIHSFTFFTCLYYLFMKAINECQKIYYFKFKYKLCYGTQLVCDFCPGLIY